MSSPARIAIITGAARGIGREIALRLAKDGLDIALNDLPTSAEELEAVAAEIRGTHAKRCIIVHGDVSSEEDVNKLVNTTVEELGGLDVMVANAGIALCTPLLKGSVEDWDRVQAVNTRGVFLCYKAAAAQMVKQGRGGRIIGAASILGKRGLAEWGGYSASKFAVRGLTQAAADELKPHGITVNAYAPGIVGTINLWENASKSREKYGLEPIDYVKMTSIMPADIAGLVSYIASEEARSVTGQSISINEGMFFD